MSKFSESLRNARHQKNMTQEQLASKLYVSKQAVSKWESGKGYPDAEIWPVLAEILEVSIDALMGRSIEKAEKTVMVKGKIRIKRFVLILILFFIITIPIIFWMTSFSLPSRTGFQKIIQIEELANIDLPDHGELETYNFVEWERYNALPPMSQLGYIVFSNKREIQCFNDKLSNNDQWLKEFDSTLYEIIPQAAYNYAKAGDFHLIYNVDLNQYNQLPETEGIYTYIYLCYQNENDRLIFFEYEMPYYEGGK